MRSSTWRALGNTYVVVETDGGALDAERAAMLAGGADGVLEVLTTAPGPGRDRDLESRRITRGALGERNANRCGMARRPDGRRRDRRHRRDRVVHTRLLEDGLMEQDLGGVTIGPAETVDGVSFVPVSVGNPHAVVLGDPSRITDLGPLLETHARFPERTNVQVARVEAPGEVTARVWERGVGETLSSGTSAVAVAAATHGEGDVLVHFPGGDLRVRLEDGRATLYGSAERIS